MRKGDLALVASKDDGFFVYAMICDSSQDSFIKIGKSRCITKRIKSVQTGCPLEIHTVLKLSYPDQESIDKAERVLHQKLGAYRTCGEWFSIDFSDEVDAGRFADATEEVLPPGQSFWEVIPLGSQLVPRGRYKRLSKDPEPPPVIKWCDIMTLEAFQRRKRGLEPNFWRY